jgi:hypothetical protein
MELFGNECVTAISSFACYIQWCILILAFKPVQAVKTADNASLPIHNLILQYFINPLSFQRWKVLPFFFNNKMDLKSEIPFPDNGKVADNETFLKIL